MAGPIYIDRVQETTTTSGTGTYTLAGAVTGFQSFAAVGDANTCYYAATDGIDWEVGLGTYTASGTTLARTAVLASSNGGAAVSWSGTTKNIWVDAAAIFFTGLVTAAASFSPTANDGKALGTTSLGWSDLFGATGFTINFANGDWIATHSSGVLTVGTGDLRVTTAGTNGASVVTNAGTQTLTNKRVTPRVTTITSSGTPTVNTDNCDAVDITAQAAAITSMTTNLSGTPTNFQKLIYRIKDNGTARAITWGASFVALGITLPTTTVINKILTVGFIYNTTTSTWGCVASAQEA